MSGVGLLPIFGPTTGRAWHVLLCVTRQGASVCVCCVCAAGVAHGVPPCRQRRPGDSAGSATLQLHAPGEPITHNWPWGGRALSFAHVSPLLFLTLCCMAQWTATAEITWLRNAHSFTRLAPLVLWGFTKRAGSTSMAGHALFVSTMYCMPIQHVCTGLTAHAASVTYEVMADNSQSCGDIVQYRTDSCTVVLDGPNSTMPST
jgi:hypothetical protein